MYEIIKYQVAYSMNNWLKHEVTKVDCTTCYQIE